jgi:demethylmenaquinone methyltransferase/2-methoxy-6-polyprenyl-1,4-benzoquinol methylase
VTTALPDPRPGPGKEGALVQAMFDRIAGRYDLANTLFSLGQDRHWRRVAVAAADPQPGQVVLDVAAGTGALAHALRDRGARVVALDLSLAMLRTGAARPAAARLTWVNGDATRLPLPDASVDVVTIAFGLRNLPDAAAGLRELARVTRPGGRLVVLEFTRPESPAFRRLYLHYLVGALPALARLFTADARAYRYLADSIQAWPAQAELAATMAACGWARPRWKNLTGGIVAVHHAQRELQDRFAAS